MPGSGRNTGRSHRDVKHHIDQMAIEICVRESVENESKDMQEMGSIWKTLKKIGSFFLWG